MATFTSPSAGDEIVNTHITQFVNALQAGDNYQFTFAVLAATDFVVRLPEAAGAREFQVQDSGSVVVATIDSDGNADFEGLLTAGSSNTQLTTAAGLLRLQAGGLGADISTIATGGLITGSGAGTVTVRALGTASQVPQVNAGGTDWAWAATGWPPPIASDLTQATTTSSAFATGATITGLTEAVGNGLLGMVLWSKASGATTAQGRIQVNSTIITATISLSDATAEAQSGVLWFLIAPGRDATYNRGIDIFGAGGGATAAAIVHVSATTVAGTLPNGNITDITIDFASSDNATTVRMDEFRLYRVVGS